VSLFARISRAAPSRVILRRKRYLVLSVAIGCGHAKQLP
jgi:hypothetical protein